MARFIVEIPDTDGMTKRDLAAYVRSAIKSECGNYLPGDPEQRLCKKRSQMKVRHLSEKQYSDIQKIWGL